MQQARYKSSEQALLRAINTNLRQSPMMTKVNNHIYDKQQDGIGYDADMNKVAPFTYLIVGETNITSQYSSASHTENVAVTFHLYHRSDSLAVMDDTRGLLDDLQYFAEQLPVMGHYAVTKTRVDTKQTLLDIDLETIHGILRMSYTVKHKTRY